MSERHYQVRMVFNAEPLDQRAITELEQDIAIAVEGLLPGLPEAQITDVTCKGCGDAWGRRDGYCPACFEVNRQVRNERSE